MVPVVPSSLQEPQPSPDTVTVAAMARPPQPPPEPPAQPPEQPPAQDPAQPVETPAQPSDDPNTLTEELSSNFNFFQTTLTCTL